MVAFYPLCAFGENRVAASIDTPLHAFLPFAHVDHLHPDWAIALAASANGETEAAGVQRDATAASIIWVPWQRPGFELGADAASAPSRRHPGCDGTHSRRPRPLHVGRHAARVLPEQHPHHRPDGPVHRGARASASGRPLFGGAAVTATVRSRGGGRVDPAVSARRRLVEPARRSRTATAPRTR